MHATAWTSNTAAGIAIAAAVCVPAASVLLVQAVVAAVKQPTPMRRDGNGAPGFAPGIARITEVQGDRTLSRYRLDSTGLVLPFIAGE